MRDAVKRVLVTIAVLQGLLLLSSPLWSSAFTYLGPLPGHISISVTILLIGGMIWGAAEIANRLIDRKDPYTASAACMGSPMGGMTPDDLAVILAAKDNLRRVRRAIACIDSPEATAALEELVALAEEGLALLPAAPQRLRGLRRPLEYHLPKVAELAEGLASIHDRPDQWARAARIAAVLTGLADQFRAQREGLAAPDMRLLDVEIKMLENALSSEKVGRMASNLMHVAS
jgi:hypothetical protein